MGHFERKTSYNLIEITIFNLKFHDRTSQRNSIVHWTATDEFFLHQKCGPRPGKNKMGLWLGSISEDIVNPQFMGIKVK